MLDARSGGASTLADEPTSLTFGEPTPHALLLARGDRVLEARFTHGADPTDRLGGLGELVGVGRRVEHVGVGAEAARVLAPRGARRPARRLGAHHVRALFSACCVRPCFEKRLAADLARDVLSACRRGGLSARSRRRMQRVTSGTVPPHDAGREGIRGQSLAMVLAFAATLPAVGVRLSGAHPPEYVAPVIFGFAILGSAF